MNWTSISCEELIRACINDHATAAWEEFVRRFRPVIGCTVMRTVRRFGQSAPDLIDDLVQDTYLKICANRCYLLRQFQPESPDAIFGWLKTVALSVVLDHFRREGAEKRGAGRREFALETYAASVVADREGLPQIEREILLQQIDEILDAASEPATLPRDRQIFWLYYRHGMTARAIAAIPGLGLTQRGIESVIQRLCEHVRSSLVELKRKGLEGKSSRASL